MKANELRIGNYIDGNSKITGIDSVKNLVYVTVSGGYGAANLDSCNPIPLTPEILEMAGFVKDGRFESFSGHNGDKYHHAFIMPECCLFDDGGFYLLDIDGTTISMSIENVHELQNLYFALTGQELTIDLNH